MKKAWYVFMGGGDPFSTASYIKTSKHKCLCGENIAVIYAEDNGLQPAEPLSKNLVTYIKDALATGMIQPDKPFNAKKYVYLR